MAFLLLVIWTGGGGAVDWPSTKIPLMLGVEIWEEFRVCPWDDWLGWWWGRLGSTTGVGCGRGEKTPVAIVGGFAGLSGCCSLTEPFHMWKLGWTDGCTTTGLCERMASATEMLTNGLENSWKLELGDVSTCTGNEEGGMEKACPGTTTGISGLTDSPSDEKFETLRAIPFLSCFLKKKIVRRLNRFQIWPRIAHSWMLGVLLNIPLTETWSATLMFWPRKQPECTHWL